VVLTFEWQHACYEDPVSVCVCVCVRQRERERESARAERERAGGVGWGKGESTRIVNITQHTMREITEVRQIKGPDVRH
jgi:hypothetical protein